MIFHKSVIDDKHLGTDCYGFYIIFHSVWNEINAIASLYEDDGRSFHSSRNINHLQRYPFPCPNDRVIRAPIQTNRTLDNGCYN